MNVLHISPCPIWDDEEKSGMPSIYWGLKGFVDAGHQVTYMFPGKQSRCYNYEGFWIREFRLWVPQISPKYIWLHRLFNKITAIVFFVVAPIQVLRVSRSFKPDVIYGHFHGAPVAWLVGKIRGIPNITRIFGTFLFRHLGSLKGKLRNMEEMLTFKTPCTYMIITNDGTRGDECAELLGVPAEKVKHWTNGINKDVYDPHYSMDALKKVLSIPRDSKVILKVSRLAKWKGVDRLIMAMRGVVRLYPDVVAVIVGDGEERGNLEDLAKRLGIHENVRFVGSILHEEIPKYLNPADIFVSLYHIGVGNPTLEALSCGKCVVTINNKETSGFNKHGEVAVLVDENGLDALPAKLVDLLRDDEKRDCLGRAAREYAVNHLQTWPERIAMEVNFIVELVNRNRRQT